MASEVQHFTLVADTEKVFTFLNNGGRVRVTQVANPAVVFCNAKNVAIGAVGGDMTGNDVMPASLGSLTVADETSGTATIVRVRSAGTPTVAVRVW